jgi:hypothetical protein
MFGSRRLSSSRIALSAAAGSSARLHEQNRISPATGLLERSVPEVALRLLENAILAVRHYADHRQLSTQALDLAPQHRARRLAGQIAEASDWLITPRTACPSRPRP